MSLVIAPINSVGGLFIGGRTAAMDVKTLIDNKITAVISVLAGFKFIYPKEIVLHHYKCRPKFNYLFMIFLLIIFLNISMNAISF